MLRNCKEYWSITEGYVGMTTVAISIKNDSISSKLRHDIILVETDVGLAINLKW